jgi:hypothetical protein
MSVVVQQIGVPTTAKSIGEWVKQHTIAVAEKALVDEVGRGFDASPVVVTDGMPRRHYDQVKPFGKIEFIANTSLAEAVRWALTQLQKRSPVKTGRYASSHVVLLNGEEVKGNIWATLRRVKPTDKVQIVNPQPYARKIERATSSRKTGRQARKALSSQARSGVYQPVLRALVSRFGKSMFFDFKYVKLAGAAKVWGRAGGRRSELAPREIIRGKGGRIEGWTRPGRDVKREQVFPALQFFIKPTGLPN